MTILAPFYRSLPFCIAVLLPVFAFGSVTSIEIRMLRFTVLTSAGLFLGLAEQCSPYPCRQNTGFPGNDIVPLPGTKAHSGYRYSSCQDYCALSMQASRTQFPKPDMKAVR